METTLGKRIAALRRDKGLKQDELAQQLGVTPQAVSKWENDQTCPDITLLPQLAKILGVSVDELLSGKAEPEVPAVRVLPAEQRKDLKDMVLRIVVDSAEGDKVRVNLPLGLVEAALDMGMDVTQFTGTDALKGIDLGKILDLVRLGGQPGGSGVRPGGHRAHLRGVSLCASLSKTRTPISTSPFPPGWCSMA